MRYDKHGEVCFPFFDETRVSEMEIRRRMLFVCTEGETLQIASLVEHNDGKSQQLHGL